MVKQRKEFYIVDKNILPASIQKVIEVNELIQSKKISKYEAIKEVGISRSTYYKYKDYIKPFFEENKDTVFTIYLSLEDKSGVLSKVLDIIADSEMNILTIIQNIPVDGIAHTSIAVHSTKEGLKELETTLENIKGIKEVKEIRIIGNS